MKNFLKKHWAFIGWLFAVCLDQSTGLVEHLINDSFWQNFIYIIGTGALGYFWTSNYNVNIVKDILDK
jgi:hypothetical protein